MTKFFTIPTTIKLDIYEEQKYFAEEPKMEITYHNVTYFSVMDGIFAEEIERDCDEEMIDENHEYLVIGFEDGDTATFRNSHVDLFKVGRGICYSK